MKFVRTLILSALLMLPFAGRASAQYLWMDSNGDGVSTAADVMNPNGVATTVDVWINTSHNRDGSLAECNSADGDLAIWNSFATHVNVLNGTATFGNYVNQVAAFTIACVQSPGIAFRTNNTTEMSQCQATGSPEANGGVNIFLYTMTVTGTAGTPSLEFVTTNLQDQNVTSFGTQCSTNDFDNTYTLGRDWFDVDGIGPAPVDNAAPVINAPATASGTENQPITIQATVTDADGDALTFSASGHPASLSFSTTAGPPLTGTLSGTLGFADEGTHNIIWTANDGVNPDVTATTVLTVANVDRAPIVTAPATASGAENTLITFTVSAADPDGEAILGFSAAGTAITAGGIFTKNASNTSGTFNWTPNSSQAGSYSATFTANNSLSGSATTDITVTDVDSPPTVTAPATASGDEGTLISFTVSATDPDGDAITSLTAAPLPSGATFTANASNTSGTFDWTPSFTQAGLYTVTFTAANALSGSASTDITVNNVDQAPVVTAPATVSTPSNTLVNFTVTAVDPDGDAIASLTGGPLPGTSTFTTNASNTSGTFDWTPNNTNVGTHTVTFTASNALVGSATTEITVTSGDRAPTVTAPGAVSGDENTNINFTVLATDPDGDAINDFTAAPLPSGATFTTSAANTSGTFDWTPDFTQSGTYNVTFTATNALSGSATTGITVNNVDRAPVVTAPATASGDEGTLISFTVSAVDPDGDAIASLTAAPLPAGATFVANASNTSGTFDWTPSFSQSGLHTVTFTASNALSGSASTDITVNNVDQAPVVTAPATAGFNEGIAGSFTVSAVDPDGDAIASLTAAGTAITAGATFTANASNTSGTLSWTPGFGDAGSYSVTFTASNALSGSATTDITVSEFDQAPVVTAPATASGDENTLISFTVSAVDPDGDAITSLTAAPLPAGATFTANASNTSGTFDWTPDFTQSGTYNVIFTASNALSGSATTVVTVNNVDRAPVVTAPATASGNEGTLISFTVSAVDPDGDAISSLTAAPLPAGATFTANATNTSGTFDWTPDNTQAGTYNVTFTAANALSGSATTEITVINADVAPVVTAPPTVSGAEGTTITFTVTAADPDGDAIASLTAAPLPGTATFTANASNTSGTFDWATTPSDGGTYNVIFTASNALSGSATTVITVTGENQNPVVTAPATASGDEGTLITFVVSATDGDGDNVSLQATGVPSGASFVDNGDNTGTFSWTPGFNQSGSYSVTFLGSDGNGGTGSATTVITVNNVNRAPTADAGGPYSGVINVAIAFDGTGSSDPDGDVLTYSWDFGDGESATGATPSHAYAAAGAYTVTLTVTDPGTLSDDDVTTATVSASLQAAAFTVGGNKTTSLGAGKPYTCVQLEAVNNSFQNTDVNLSSIKMISIGTGSVSEIFADITKTTIDGDKNQNGVQEIAACFTKDDLRLLFSSLPAGRNTVDVTIEGSLTTGATFTAELTMIVKSTGAVTAASISPNPLNPLGKLTFSTTKPGAVRVQMFDPQGRLVKTIADEASVHAGYHDYTIDGRSASGSKLASGVYFVQVWSQHDGSEVKRVTIMK